MHTFTASFSILPILRNHTFSQISRFNFYNTSFGLMFDSDNFFLKTYKDGINGMTSLLQVGLYLQEQEIHLKILQSGEGGTRDRRRRKEISKSFKLSISTVVTIFWRIWSFRVTWMDFLNCHSLWNLLCSLFMNVVVSFACLGKMYKWLIKLAGFCWFCPGQSAVLCYMAFILSATIPNFSSCLQL